MTATSVTHLPVLRAGKEYESLDQNELRGYRDGAVLARVSQANAGLIRRDLKRLFEAAAPLRALSTPRLLEICREAGRQFLEGTLSLNAAGDVQSPEDYVSVLSASTGLPHTLCRRNMQKVFTVFDQMPTILAGLMRGMGTSVFDDHFGEHSGIPVCYYPATHGLGVVLPSNSPGVNSIWMPAIAMKIPVVLKPGREEPWTPVRIMAAFIAAGCPREAFSLYPTTHEGAAAILEGAGRALLFGDEGTTQAYAGNPAINLHGPGRSKILIGEDEIDHWEDHLDVLVGSVGDNGGRSCINASTLFVPRHGDAIADALARRLAGMTPRAADDPEATLPAFANPKFAEFIEGAIESGITGGGAVDASAPHREGPRHQIHSGAHFLLPTIVRCASVDHALAKTEFLFPFASVVEIPESEMVKQMGPSLVVTALTKNPDLVDALVCSPHVDRLNVGPVPTSRVEWDQPHEGNLFEFLYRRRAIQAASGWSP